ncbi:MULTISPECIES: hypothetical protein [Halocynthiibacter]|uniref:Uncharacterized protein n=1 Tax=Halocynthiibacter halioticoli TaxID=2986804 RepID=A0AAE3IZ53_9RHOB|nr:MULTISPECIES: hypothetical protein [Halocynthiibacter]MCV6823583.1 hypothetical protein [Halocynthiibacter halioticoli]MCW4056584.1 hypothetical protein [Halocynthiibacter sp. SDUM655004]
MFDVFGAVMLLAFIALALCAVYLLFAIIGDMAKARGHSPWAWWTMSLLWSPIGSIFVLWLFFPIETGRDSN